MRVAPPTVPGTHGFVAAALGWLDDHLTLFDPQVWNRWFPPRPFPAGPVLELLLAHRAVRRARVPGFDGVASRMLDVAERVCAQPAFADGLRRGDHLFVHHTWLLAMLDGAGRPPADLLAVARHVAAATVVSSADLARTDIAELEAAYVLPAAGVDMLGPDGPAAAARLIASVCRDPLALTPPDLYTLTHLVFYITDFGAAPWPHDRLGDPRLTEAVLAHLGAHAARGDADLTAELLLCADVLGHGRHPAAELARFWLAAAADASGWVPGPQYTARRRLDGERADAYVFGTSYHTTLVALMTAAHEGTTR